jgi:hypothetical protein
LCPALKGMSSIAEIAGPIARAINIYCSVAGHGIDIAARRDLARHIKRLADQGVADPSRLTVHGLSYLQNRSHDAKANATNTPQRKVSRGRAPNFKAGCIRMDLGRGWLVIDLMRRNGCFSKRSCAPAAGLPPKAI